jgi:hypothetical protein
MEIDDPKIVALQEKVSAAQEEFDMAVAFHEVWKPTAYDQNLHSRLGNSYATQAFLIIRTALRREMLLALMRLWDKNKQSIGMQSVWVTLREKEVMEAFVQDRAKSFGLLDVIGHLREDLGKKVTEALLLISKYMEGGTHHALFEKLLTMRHERLAHRQRTPSDSMPALFGIESLSGRARPAVTHAIDSFDNRIVGKEQRNTRAWIQREERRCDTPRYTDRPYKFRY